MPELVVGRRSIPYVVRRSSRVRRRRIVVTPGQVEVVAPDSHSDEEIAAFVHSRRRWVHDQTERMEEQVHWPARPGRFASGAKVLYRGRRLMLTVTTAPVDHVAIRCRGAFQVTVPEQLPPGDRDAAIASAFETWFRDRVRRDAESIARRFAPRLGVVPHLIRVKDQKHLWGSCGKDGTIHLNWHLAFAPKAVLEYAVVHEMCHLLDRSHDPSFWRLLQRVLPEYEARKAWLDSNELSCRWV